MRPRLLPRHCPTLMAVVLCLSALIRTHAICHSTAHHKAPPPVCVKEMSRNCCHIGYNTTGHMKTHDELQPAH
ncbi:hypothetical protein E2C01_022557 [Portunus trituberculatus]|uniref:Secreted protein n=1 Tax=Portunus trituberculatus TaxID=210409 RepID=A0A5B7E7D7_PORTR|nr:hypothetical protein [Portunus trituberculatus]